MPRLMSFALTEPPVRQRTETVTWPAGWLVPRPGDRVTPRRKAQGRRFGEPLERSTDVELVSIHRERLDAIIATDHRRAPGAPKRKTVLPR
ncbi:hypothetical protein AB0C34_03350 [Nocardia sp. NPDC049220]|uniref:hypothetical protein n=1 Tax=Nocardia sp. NPDC049220 TaxID=3155273 RepID=UPI0033F3B57E